MFFMPDLFFSHLESSEANFFGHVTKNKIKSTKNIFFSFPFFCFEIIYWF